MVKIAPLFFYLIVRIPIKPKLLWWVSDCLITMKTLHKSFNQVIFWQLIKLPLQEEQIIFNAVQYGSRSLIFLVIFSIHEIFN